MARPRSEEKRALLLDAAAGVVAERGDSAPTALIARAARVAEGSLFTYFRNKEELLTELYGALVAEALAVVRSAHRARAGKRERSLLAWTSIVRWALANPRKWKTVRVLGLSNLVDERRRRDTVTSGRQFLAQELGIPDDPPGFPTRALSALVDVTIDLTRHRPQLAEQYSAAGFEAFWRAVTRR